MESTLTWFLCLNIIASITADPCTDYDTIDDWKRSVANGLDIACDSLLNPGWYRIISKAGELMPTECIHYGSRCGTGYSIWLNGTYPVDGETANVTACASDFNHENCCYKSYDIQIKNCSTFYVYNLVPVIGCPQSYCFGAELPCPEGQTSPTGYTPGCKFDPCLEMNYKELDEYRRSVNYTENAYICDSTLEAGWYRPTSLAGDQMPTECPINGMTCGTSFPIWLNGTFPIEGETNNVTACSSSHIHGCCSSSYDIVIKNCGGFYVYNLSSTIGCASGYCFGTELPCPVGETSDNGFTPGCEFDPCQNYDTLSGEDKRSASYKVQDGTPLDDSELKNGWYRFDSYVGNDLVNSSQPIGSCGTNYPVWLDGYLPSKADKTVNRTCCITGNTDTCESTVNIQVRNCGNFMVYNLSKTVKIQSAYCVGLLPVTTTTPTTTTLKPPHFDGSKSDGGKKEILTIATVLAGLICCVFILAILFVKCIRKSNKSQMVSCVSIQGKPPPYTETTDYKKNIMAETNVVTNVEQMKTGGKVF